MLTHLLKGQLCILKVPILAKAALAVLNSLEDWEDDRIDQAAPHSLEANDVKWVQVVTSQKFLLDNELTSSEALSA